MSEKESIWKKSWNLPGFIKKPFEWIFSKKGLKASGFLLACLATLYLLAYSIENWRGKKAWKRAVAEAHQLGENLDPAYYVPPPVPDEQNYAMISLFRPFVEQRQKKGDLFPDVENPPPGTNLWNAAEFAGWAPAFGIWLLTELPDIREARKQLLKHKRHFASKASMQLLISKLETLGDQEDPTALFLEHFQKYQREFDELEAARHLPESRFPINYADGFASLLPALGPIRGIARSCSMRALLELTQGNTTAAADFILDGLRVSEAIKNEPLMISALVRSACLQIMIAPIGQGLAQQRWNPEQLRDFQESLSRIDVLGQYVTSIRHERNLGIQLVEEMKGSRDLSALDTSKKFSGAFLWLIPGGWFDQNSASLFNNSTTLSQVFDEENRRFNPELVEEFGIKVGKSSNSWANLKPYSVFSRILLPAMENYPKRMASTQALLDLSVLACALERFRLDQNQYPEKLSQLAPHYVESLPRDLVTGEELIYRRSGDSYILYSRGWNGQDDGGKIVMTNPKSKRVDYASSDWYWPTRELVARGMSQKNEEKGRE